MQNNLILQSGPLGQRRALVWALLLAYFVVPVAMAESEIPGAWKEAPSEYSPESILASLTIEEKVGQLFIIYHGPPQFMAEHGFGGSLIFESMVAEPDTLRASLAQAQRLCSIPLLVAIDQEGGEINRLRPLPGLGAAPSARAMGKMSRQQIFQATRPAAMAMVGLGINLNLAPVVDPAHDDLGNLTLMGQRDRAFGSSAEIITASALAVIDSYAEQGNRPIGCIVKHFPGYIVQPNSDHELAHCDADLATLENHIIPFAVPAAQATGVMMSSIIFTSQSQVPAVLDPTWVQRARCGQDQVLVMTDDLWGGALRKWISGTNEVEPVDYPPEDLRRLVLMAFDAGNDMLMVTFPRKAVEMKAILVEEIAQDGARRSSLDQSVLRILQVKKDLGLF